MFTENEIQESEAIESTAKTVQVQQQATELSASNAIPSSFDCNLWDLPVSSRSLVSQYWKPEIGATIRGKVIGFEKRVIDGEFAQIDRNTGEIKPIEIAVLVCQAADGSEYQLESGSTALYGVLKECVDDDVIQIDKSILMITYLGRIGKGKRGNYDKWDIRLIGNGAA